MTGAPRRLDWRSGGWLLLLAVALVLAVVAWRLAPWIGSSSHAVGDGRDPESYGFALDTLDLPRERVAAAGFPKDGIPALVDPPAMAGRDVAAFNEQRRGKYLVSSDRVIGVVIGGEARAYPLRVLNWHEVINDSLDGVPIAVTYHPLCESAVVFDRRVGGETVELGVSGLLYNSNLLMYDRRADAREESLWSQLLARAVAGPAAGRRAALTVLPASLTRWGRWLREHPATTVVAPDPRLVKRYERDPYGNYLLTGEPRFPVEPLPPQGKGSYMRRVVVLDNGSDRWLGALDASPAGTSPAVREPLPGARVTIEAEQDGPPSVTVDPATPPLRTFYALWFAWYAHHPDAELR